MYYTVYIVLRSYKSIMSICNQSISYKLGWLSPVRKIGRNKKKIAMSVMAENLMAYSNVL